MSISKIRATKHFIISADQFGEFNLEIYTDDINELNSKKESLLKQKFYYLEINELINDEETYIFNSKKYINNEITSNKEEDFLTVFTKVHFNNDDYLFLSSDKAIEFTSEKCNLKVTKVTIIKRIEFLENKYFKDFYEVWVDNNFVAEFEDENEANSLAKIQQTHIAIPIISTVRGNWEVNFESGKIMRFTVKSELLDYVRYLKRRTNEVFEVREILNKVKGRKKFEFDKDKDFCSKFSFKK